MKRLNIYLSLVLFLSMTSVQIFAQTDYSSDGIYYILEDGKASVTFNERDVDEEGDPDYNDYFGNIVIPSSVTYYGNTFPVTSIGEFAFRRCSGLTSVTIPSSVTSIEYAAFQECSSLTRLTIPRSVTSIGDRVFIDCTSLTSMTVCRETPPLIYSDNFYNCNLNNATLYVPAGSKAAYEAHSVWGKFSKVEEFIQFEDAKVKDICVANWDTNGDGELSEDEAAAVTELGQVFRNNKNITSFNELQYFTGLSSISNEAFNGCSNLTSVIIPSSVNNIGAGAFYGAGLTDINIPTSVTTIGESAFKHTALNSVSFPNSVTSVGNGIFYATNLTQPVYNSTIFAYMPPSYQGNYSIPTGINNISSSSFADCASLTSVSVPNSVTSIDDLAFAGCSSLTSVISKIETPFAFGSNAFWNVSSTCVLTVPKGKRDAYIAAGWTEDVFKGGVIEEEIVENVTIAMKTGSGADRTMIGYSSQYSLDFTGINDVKAYIVIGFTDTKGVLMARVYVVPANTGVVLKSDVAGVEVEVPTTTSDMYYANLLKPAVNNVTIYPTQVIDGVNYTNLMVGKLDNQQMGFVTLPSSNTYSNKCYLQIPTAFYESATSAREGGMEIVFVDDETTDIRSLMHNGSATNDTYYDLQGRKVTPVKKGIYIHNGKKVIVR